MATIIPYNEEHKRNLRFVSNPDLNGKTFTINLCHDNKDGTMSVPLYYARSKNLNEVPKYKATIKTKFSGKLWNSQKEVSVELKKIFLNYGSAFLQLHCGFGKTILAVWLISTLKLKSLILLTRTSLIRQWEQTCDKYISGGECKFITKDNFEDAIDSSICICMVFTLKHMDDYLLNNFDLVIVDEAKTFCSPIVSKLLLNLKPKYTLGLSADYKRVDGMHKMMKDYYGPHNIIRTSTKSFVVYRFNTRFKPKIEFKRYSRYKTCTNWNLIEESIAECQERNKMIAYLCKIRPFDKILILCKRRSQADNILGEISKLNIKAETYMGSDRKYKDTKVLVCTVQKAGIGFDAKSSCEIEDAEHFNLLIMASSVKEIEQNSGRVFRADIPEIIDIVDDYSLFRKHFEEFRLPWYKSRNGIIFEEWV